MQGARFQFQVDEGPTGDHNIVSFQWRSKSIQELYPKRYTTWLIQHFFSQLADGTVVHGCTEHKRQEKFLFRAHPAYRGHQQWYDWAVFDWVEPLEVDNEDPVRVPGQIIFFLELTDEMIGLDIAGRMAIQNAGLFALIETLEDPLPLPVKGTEVVIPASKALTAGQKRKRRRGQQNKPNIYLVPVDSIYEPISAIPDLGGNAGDFLFIRPSDSWACCFTDYIDMCHGDLD